MAIVTIMNPTQITNSLKYRLNITNNLFSLSNGDCDTENLYYFKYYFDIFTAIEATLRGLVYKFALASNCEGLIKNIMKPSDEGTPYFLEWKKVDNILLDDSIMSSLNSSKYKEDYQVMIPILSNERISFPFADKKTIETLYTSLKKIRNKLAHSLNPLSSSIVEFSKDKLNDIMIIYSILHHYYTVIYEN